MTSATTTIVPTPPLTTEKTGPNQWATSPDSNAPNSLDELIKIAFTAATRPRIESGVSNCISVPRTTTLTLSNAPARASMKNDSQAF